MEYFSIKKFANHVRNIATDAPRNEDSDELKTLARKIKKLSEVQGLRLHTWAFDLMLALKNAICFLCENGNERCWGTVSFEVDAVQKKYGSENRTFLRLLGPWLSAYSRQYPFVIFDDIIKPENPFVRKYVREDDGIDIKRMIDGNIRFCDSKGNMGIQAADIAAYIIFDAARSPLDDDALDIYANLMDSCPYLAAEGPGFVYFSSPSGLAGVARAKYDHLAAILDTRRKTIGGVNTIFRQAIDQGTNSYFPIFPKSRRHGSTQD